MAGRETWDPARPGAGAGYYQCVFSEARAAEIVARVAAGESVSSVCRTAGMPERHTVRNWMTAHPEFGTALKGALREVRLSQRLVELEILKLKRKRLAIGGGRGGPKTTYTPEVGEAICARLVEGESLTAICRDPELPCYKTVMNWVRVVPEFNEMYVEARAQSAEWLFDEARDVALGSTKDTVTSDRLRFDVIRWQAAKLAPRKYVEKLKVELIRDEDAREQAQREALDKAAREGRTVLICDFFVGPAGEVLCDPPRNDEEEERWIRAYGKPYEGPYGHWHYKRANDPKPPKWVLAPPEELE